MKNLCHTTIQRSIPPVPVLPVRLPDEWCARLRDWYCGNINITLIIHEGKKSDELFLKDGTVTEPRYTDNADFKFVQTIINFQLEC